MDHALAGIGAMWTQIDCAWLRARAAAVMLACGMSYIHRPSRKANAQQEGGALGEGMHIRLHARPRAALMAGRADVMASAHAAL